MFCMLDKRRLKAISLLCIFCAIGAVTLWLIIVALIGLDASDAGIVFPAFIAMAVAMSAVILIRNFINENFARKLIAQTAMTVFTVAIMYGTFYLSNFMHF